MESRIGLAKQIELKEVIDRFGDRRLLVSPFLFGIRGFQRFLFFVAFGERYPA